MKPECKVTELRSIDVPPMVAAICRCGISGVGADEPSAREHLGVMHVAASVSRRTLDKLVAP